MPKIVSEDERRLIKEAIYEKTIQLIKEKGVRAITVEDITGAVGLGKGSFYAYFPSREVCLFETIVRANREVFIRMEEAMSSIHSDKNHAVCILNEIFMAGDSIVQSINTTDLEVLLRKLPPEYQNQLKGESESNFQKAMRLMELDSNQMEVVALLSDCICYGASIKLYSQAASKQAMRILINAMVDFVVDKETESR